LIRDIFFLKIVGNLLFMKKKGTMFMETAYGLPQNLPHEFRETLSEKEEPG
jgi:hypothetical protein